MLFHSPKLVVVLATVHVPLADVPRLLSVDMLADVITLTAESMSQFGVARPRIAVVGLNPHAGEEGVLGSEDRAVIRPAVENYQELPLGLHWLDPGIIDFAFGRGPDAPRATPHQRKILPRKLAQRMLPSETGTFAQAAVHALAESVARGRMERRLSNIYRLFALTMLELWRREYHSQLPSGA
jgi:Pyridoxal phosphate biosynthetic protein PdxA